jgi:endonuclease IV
VQNAVNIGAKSFAMFLASQRSWTRKPLDDLSVAKFRLAVEVKF